MRSTIGRGCVCPADAGIAMDSADPRRIRPRADLAIRPTRTGRARACVVLAAVAPRARRVAAS